MKPIVSIIVACTFSLPATAASKITAVPFCVFNETSVVAHTVVEERWTGKDINGDLVSPNIKRTLWQINCTRSTGACQAVMVSLDNVDAGKPVGFMDIITPVGMTLASVVGKVATITWPLFVTVTIDLSKKQLVYRSSGDRMEGVGYGSCDMGSK